MSGRSEIGGGGRRPHVGHATERARSMAAISRRKMRHRHMRAKARQYSPTRGRDRHFVPRQSPRIGLTGRADARKEDIGDHLSWEVL